MFRHCNCLYSIFCLYVFTLNAQFSISGKIWDAESNTAIGFATIGLIQAEEESIIQGNLSKADGSFEFNNVEAGIYTLKINYLGFEEKSLQSFCS